jgi:flavin-dependent dehydrogenase
MPEAVAGCAAAGIQVHPDGVAVGLQQGGGCSTLTARLLIDCMGHASPVVRQVRGWRGLQRLCRLRSWQLLLRQFPSCSCCCPVAPQPDAGPGSSPAPLAP